MAVEFVESVMIYPGVGDINKKNSYLPHYSEYQECSVGLGIGVGMIVGVGVIVGLGFGLGLGLGLGIAVGEGVGDATGVPLRFFT